MNTINLTGEFRGWLANIKDKVVKGAALDQINRASQGLFSDCHDLGDGAASDVHRTVVVGVIHEAARPGKDDGEDVRRAGAQGQTNTTDCRPRRRWR